jgi:hypothetical protein
MNRSESIANLSAALSKAQGMLKNPHFDSVNPHFKSKFASLAAVREAVIPVLSKCGLSLSQWPVSNGSYAGCVTLLAHDSGEWVEETFVIPVDKANAHGYASAVTYAKRISMQSVAAVVGDEDDDGNAAIDKPAPAISGAAVKQEAYESLDTDEKTFIDDLADMVTRLVAKGDASGALQEVDHAIPQEGANRAPKADTLIPALWHKLDSKTRSALKKARDESKGK